jgi:hypothetical protein
MDPNRTNRRHVMNKSKLGVGLALECVHKAGTAVVLALYQRRAKQRAKARWHPRFVNLPRVLLATIAVSVGFALPSLGWAQATLENPGPESFHSGVGIVSGWVCDASRVDLVFDDAETFQAAYGTIREDTISRCGDANNGFGLLLNWNRLGDGLHSVRALADGVEFGSATFTVTTMLGEEFLRGAAGSYRLSGFPYPYTDVLIRWDEPLQNFVIERVEMNGSGFGPVGP